MAIDAAPRGREKVEPTRLNPLGRMYCDLNNDYRNLIKRLGRVRISASITMLHALHAAPCMAVETHPTPVV